MHVLIWQPSPPCQEIWKQGWHSTSQSEACGELSGDEQTVSQCEVQSAPYCGNHYPARERFSELRQCHWSVTRLQSGSHFGRFTEVHYLQNRWTRELLSQASSARLLQCKWGVSKLHGIYIPARDEGKCKTLCRWLVHSFWDIRGTCEAVRQSPEHPGRHGVKDQSGEITDLSERVEFSGVHSEPLGNQSEKRQVLSHSENALSTQCDQSAEFPWILGLQ